MADNSVRTPGSGESIRTVEKSAIKTGVSILDIGGSGAENLSAIGNSSGLFIQDNGNSITVDGTVAISGTVTVDLGVNNDVTLTSGTLTGITNVVHVDDNSGSLTVDQPTGTNLHTVVDSGTITTVSTVSSVSAVIAGTGATNLGKAEDAVHASGDTGVMILGVRKDTATQLAGSDGDYSVPITDASGRLWVNASGAAVPVTDNSGSLTVDNAGTFAVQADTELPAAAALADATANPTVPGVGAFNMIWNGSTWDRMTASAAGGSGDILTLPDHDAQAVAIVDSNGDQVNFGTSTQYDIDDVASATATGTMALAVRKDTAASLAGTTGDVTGLQVDSTGHLWVNASSAAVPVTDNSGSLTVDNGGTFAVQVSTALPANTNTQEVVGDAAQDAAISGNPVAVGMRASTATPTAMSADGDVVFPWTTREGAQVMVGPAADDAVLFGKPIQTGGRASTAIPTAMSADGDIVTQWLTRNGAAVVAPMPAATATLTNVSTSTASASLLASNTSRKGVVIYNDAATAVLYIKFGATASATSFTYYLAAKETIELPGAGVLYTGAIDGILDAGTGTARVTELS